MSQAADGSTKVEPHDWRVTSSPAGASPSWTDVALWRPCCDVWRMICPMLGRLATAGGLCLLIMGAGVPVGARGERAPGASQGAQPISRELLDRYCVSCHNDRLRTADLTLEVVPLDDVGGRAELWEKVVRKLRSGVMPPAGAPRPDDGQRQAFVSALESVLDRAAGDTPNPGRTETLHRLNRLEYRNAVRDLLDLTVDVQALLPADDSSYGFDNIAGVQRLSPALMERYLSAAQVVSRTAVGTGGRFATFDTTEDLLVSEDVPQDGPIEGLPLGTRGGIALRRTIPADGEYLLRLKLFRLAGSSTDELPSFDRPQQLEVSVDGERVRVFTLAPQGSRIGVGNERVGGRRDLDRDWQIRLPLRAGLRAITVAFLNRTPTLLENTIEPFLKPYGGADNSLYTTRRGAYLRSVQLSGPIHVTAPGDTPSRARIFTCRPSARLRETACAARIASALARRAYRRAVTNDDVAPLLELFAQGRQEGEDFEAGVQRMVEGLLVSPGFLFRIEHDPARPTQPGRPYRIGDVELASRLSFFLWSSIPDDELLEVAVAGRLSGPVVLERQVRRMLADDRARSLVESFASQWLLLRNVDIVSPDPNRDPDFDAALRQGFRRETELLFESIVRENRSILDLVTAPYTFLNERLARHYGVPGVYGPQFRRVTIADPNRAGLLGHGSILAATSRPDRTSPVQRGKWILENLLGSPPPPPPANVPQLEDQGQAAKTRSMRERMAMHRKNPVCASCHAKMDPLGLALENFDLVGRWRDLDESELPIDASGVSPDGTTFTGVAGLRAMLLRQPEVVATAFTERLMTYALGRGLEYYDAPAVRRVVRHAADQRYRFTDLVLGIVRSVPFQMRSPAS